MIYKYSTTRRRFLAPLVMTALAASTAVAQQPASCSGPGAALGVTAYQCASCSITQGAGMRTQYGFQAEPIVLETTTSSVLKPGDVIEAVNGQPVMTQAGADAFTYPPAGTLSLTVRRGSSRIQLAANRLGPCAINTNQRANDAEPLIVVDGVVVPDLNQLKKEDIENIEVLKGQQATSTYGDRAEHGVVVVTTKKPKPAQPKPAYAPTRTEEPIIVIDGVVQPNASSEPKSDYFWGIGQYGFAIGCVPSCTRTKASDGTQYYKFDGYPPVVAVIAGGAAERAGIRVGDVVTQIDGKSILEEEGAFRFFRANKAVTMHVTVTRNGQQVGYLLKAR